MATNIKTLCESIGATMSQNGIVSVPRESFAAQAARIVSAGAPLMFMFATDERQAQRGFTVHAVFAAKDGLFIVAAQVPENEPVYPSLVATIMAAHWYERLIHDQFDITAVGHPDWRRLVHHENIPAGTHPLKKDFEWDAKLGHAHEPYPLHTVEGKGIYEIPVGPIHAGIIEPGHFRFNVRGERIISLEGKLFFKHKGVEKLLEGKTSAEAMPFVERISGDMAVGHASAFAEAVEKAVHVDIPPRARHLRVLWNELERITAHIFDIGNMGGMGTGFTFMAAQSFRMVEEMRRLHEELAGHRFLRGAVFVGGAHDIQPQQSERILAQLERIEREVHTMLDIAYANDGLMERFETTGVLSRDAAVAYGARGPAARSSDSGEGIRGTWGRRARPGSAGA